jgi:hypothetical protein
MGTYDMQVYTQYFSLNIFNIFQYIKKNLIKGAYASRSQNVISATIKTKESWALDKHT